MEELRQAGNREANGSPEFCWAHGSVEGIMWLLDLIKEKD